MTSENILIRQLDEKEDIPYKLLLLADPSKEIIDEYLKTSKIYIALLNAKIVGTFVLCPLLDNSIEIKNIAVDSEYQGKGIGKLLLDDAIRVAKQKEYQSICIGTANSSIGQFYLYQKKGFEMTEIKRDFFIDKYSHPIYENGIQVKHMIMLTRLL